MSASGKPITEPFDAIVKAETEFRVGLFSDNDLYTSMARIVHDFKEIEEICKLHEGDYYYIVLKNSMVDFYRSLASLSNGRKIEAHITARMSLEKFVSFIWFSANELEFHLWRLHRKDVSWKMFIDNENGVFSKDFIESFSPELIELRSQFHSLTSKLYRELSEVIHGNYRSLERHEPHSDYSWVQELLEKARNMLTIFCYMWLFRFHPTKSNLLKDDGIFYELLGNIPSIRLKLENG